MTNFNSLIIEGNVCREAEVKDTQNGFQLATFSIAVNRYHKKSDGSYDQETSYFDIEAWGEMAKAVKEKSFKGGRVRIVGRLKQNRWQDTSGKTQSKVSVIAEHIDFVSKPEKKGREGNEQIETGTTFKPQKNNGSKANLFQNIPETEPLSMAAGGFDIF